MEKKEKARKLIENNDWEKNVDEFRNVLDIYRDVWTGDGE